MKSIHRFTHEELKNAYQAKCDESEKEFDWVDFAKWVSSMANAEPREMQEDLFMIDEYLSRDTMFKDSMKQLHSLFKKELT